MRLLKRTYTLPAETVETFEHEVSPRQRDKVVAGLLRDWVDRQDQTQLRRDIIQGCHEMAEVYQEIEQEYHSLEEEVHRALDAEPKTRRRRTRSA